MDALRPSKTLRRNSLQFRPGSGTLLMGESLVALRTMPGVVFAARIALQFVSAGTDPGESNCAIDA